MYQAPDYDNIVKLFNLYQEDTKTHVVSLLGFRAWMLNHMKYPAWMVKELNKQINKDANLRYHINTIAEANMVQSATLGLYKSDVAKFILKNSYGYQDTPDTHASSGATTKQITFVKAEAPKLIEAKPEETE